LQTQDKSLPLSAGVWIGIICTIVLLTTVSVGTGLTGLFMQLVTLNGYMGQDTAVNASLITYGVSALLTGIFVTIGGAFSVYFFSHSRKWNAGLASFLSIIVFSIFAAVAHLVCLVIAIIVAEGLRT
jgi:uncharacterized BrkB/YihY/UPF0761 family membrane protein